MALKFYIQVKGKVSGPLSGSELMSLAQLRKLSPTDMVRQDGSDKWVQANRIRNLDFGTPQEEPEEEIEEEILEVEPVCPNPAPIKRRRAKIPVTQLHFLLDDDDDLPPPPNYGFVEFVAGVYTFLGVLTLIGSVIAMFSIGAMESNGGDGGQKADVIFGIIIFGAITVITCFAMAQLFAMAINGSRNLHYIMHSNLVAMRVMVRQFSKKD
jgi:hypothetical protein